MLTLLLSIALAQTLTTPDAPRVQGIWRTLEAQKVSNHLYATRELQFTLSRWEETVFFASDAGMKKIALIYRAEGLYDLKKLPDQTHWHLDLKTSRRALNLQHPEKGLSDLKTAGCGLVKKREVLISDHGCGPFPSVATCGTEYELVESKDGQLILGDHSPLEFNCQNEKRPTKTGAALKRVN